MAASAPITGWSSADVDRLLAALLPERCGRASHIGSGHWSDCFAFTNDEHELVIRIGRHRADFAKDQFAARYSRPGLPIPAVRDIGRVPESPDLFFAVSDRVYGDPLEQYQDWSTVTCLLYTSDAADE